MRVQGPTPSWAASQAARLPAGQPEKSTVTLPEPLVPTVRVSPVERGPAPLVPLIVRLYVPGVTEGPTLTVSVELVPVGADGMKEPVTPLGAPARLSVTAPVKLVRVRRTVVGALPPCAIESAAGERDNPRATIGLTSFGSVVWTKTWNSNLVTVVGTVNCHVFAAVIAPEASIAPLEYW